MEKRRAGVSGLALSRLGLGTMTWGRDTDEIEAADQCRAFLDAGGNFLDTAATYGDGDSERVIGGLIGTLFARDEVIIATKAGINFTDGVRKIDASRHSLIADLDRSDSRGAAPHFAKHIEPYLDARSMKIVEAVAVAAEGLGFSPLEVALAWVRDAPGVTSALIGARTGAQLRGLLKSEEISLPDIVRTALDEISL